MLNTTKHIFIRSRVDERMRTRLCTELASYLNANLSAWAETSRLENLCAVLYRFAYVPRPEPDKQWPKYDQSFEGVLLKELSIKVLARQSPLIAARMAHFVLSGQGY